MKKPIKWKLLKIFEVVRFKFPLQLIIEQFKHYSFYLKFILFKQITFFTIWLQELFHLAWNALIFFKYILIYLFDKLLMVNYLSLEWQLDYYFLSLKLIIIIINLFRLSKDQCYYLHLLRSFFQIISFSSHFLVLWAY